MCIMFSSTYRSNILVLLFGFCLTLTLFSHEQVTLFSSNSTISPNQIEVTDLGYPVASINSRSVSDVSKTITTTTVTSTKKVDSFWTSLSAELKLDHKTQSKSVQNEIRKLLADQAKLNSILEAAAPYIYFIDQQRKARGLPAELALIPVIESEFNPNDHSNKGATGLWQLMPRTATDLGMKVKSGYDGRRNVISSTNGALAYFNDLGNVFKGNWYLAIAAYNCGEVRIQSAIRRAGDRNFWNLKVPKETQYYVPKLLAVAAIIKNPEKYGVVLPTLSNQPYFEELHIKKPVQLKQIAKSSGTDFKTLQTLNPDYNHTTVVPNKKGAYILLVPVNKASQIKEHLVNSVLS